MPIAFRPSDRSTLGVEWELQIVDPRTGRLVQEGPALLDALSSGAHGVEDGRLHREYLTNTIEIVSRVCRTVREAVDDVDRTLDRVQAEADRRGLAVTTAGSHPFEEPTLQPITPSDRYAKLVDRAQWWARQLLIYGLHVHVGVEERDKVVPLMRGMLAHIGHLQALSASSPFWDGLDTGYASNRALTFRQLPTAGTGPGLRTWADLERCLDGLLHTGVVDDVSEIRWDVRPSVRFGTVESRICDAPSNLRELAALTALHHTLIETMSADLDAGRSPRHLAHWFVEEDKWRAARYGTDAILITSDAGDELLLADSLDSLLDELAPAAERIG